MSITVNGTTGLNFPDGTSQPTAGFVPFRNKIINGDMRIDQRNVGTSITQIASTLYSCDRWGILGTITSKFTAQQSSVVPTGSGLTKSQLCTSSSAYTLVASDWFILRQRIEGNMIDDLHWGTASAKTITLSFWTRSSLTGTFGGSLSNLSLDRSYPFTYTISAANTWEYKTITIPGDTTGTWNIETNTGIQVSFSLGSGSTFSGTAGAWASSNFYSATGAVNVLGTNGATFYITGVQLEQGSSATSFEERPFGLELALCQRYYEKSYNYDVRPGTSSGTAILIGIQAASQYATVGTSYKVTKRAVPTVVVYNSSSGAAGQMIADATVITNPSVGTTTNHVFAHCNNQTTSINQFLNMHFTANAEL